MFPALAYAIGLTATSYGVPMDSPFDDLLGYPRRGRPDTGWNTPIADRNVERFTSTVPQTKRQRRRARGKRK